MRVAQAVEPWYGSPVPGQVIGGRFRVERELGAGGMGAVYAAIDLTTGGAVALKLMRQELAEDPRAVERFRREAAALAAITHPSVVRIHDVGELPSGAPFLAMELLDGETLASRLERVGRMSAPELVPIVDQIAAGLSAAHSGGVIHRDIKPSNIHLTPHAVKIVDFGVARVRGFSKVTSSGLAIGTVRYMAPEQLIAGAIDERADVYALAVVIYEALAGEHPFERTAGDDMIGAILVGRATPLSSLRPDLPPAVTQVVHRAMSRIATDRFASAIELSRAFEQAVRDPSAVVPFARPANSSHPIALAPTVAAPSVRPPPQESHESQIVESHVRQKKPPKKSSSRGRAAALILVPAIVMLCATSALAGAGIVGCQSWMSEVQVRLGVVQLRGAIHDHPELAHFETDIARLEALQSRGDVGILAASAFNARIQHALEGDNRVDATEAAWVMEIVRDILARDGDYDFETYSKMTRDIQQ